VVYAGNKAVMREHLAKKSKFGIVIFLEALQARRGDYRH
jgi:hypothetical protein